MPSPAGHGCGGQESSSEFPDLPPTLANLCVDVPLGTVKTPGNAPTLAR